MSSTEGSEMALRLAQRVQRCIGYEQNPLARLHSTSFQETLGDGLNTRMMIFKSLPENSSVEYRVRVVQMLASLKIAWSRRRRSGIPACSQQISYALSLSIWTCVGGLYGMCSSFVRRCLRLQEVKSGQSNLAPRRILDSHIFFSTFSNSAQRFVTTGGDTTHPVNLIKIKSRVCSALIAFSPLP